MEHLPTCGGTEDRPLRRCCPKSGSNLPNHPNRLWDPSDLGNMGAAHPAPKTQIAGYSDLVPNFQESCTVHCAAANVITLNGKRIHIPFPFYNVSPPPHL